MRILYVGDVMGQAGRNTLASVLPIIKKELSPDLIIVQAENSDDYGKAPRPEDIAEMQKAGADFFTGGNHSFSNPLTNVLYENVASPLVRPVNVDDKPGKGYDVITINGQKVLIASILGQTVGTRKFEITNPLHEADKIVRFADENDVQIRIFNFHGDFSSEKRVFGYYLDGSVSAVLGDHWHVPTADAMVLPKGTAHITDVGMCGALHSSLGVKTDVIVQRWKTDKSSRNEMELTGPMQFNAALIDVDELTGLARSIEHIQRIVES